MLAKVIFFGGAAIVSLAVLALIFGEGDKGLARYSVLAAIGLTMMVSIIVAAVLAV